MPKPARNQSSNPWLDQDRQNQRKLIVTVVLFGAMVAAGIGFIIYAFIHD